MNRAERRRRQRLEDKRRQAADRAGQPFTAGQGHVFSGGGVLQEYAGGRDLPPKQPGRHRWTANATYSLSLDQAAAVHDPDTYKFLDHENLCFVTIGCWDCVEPGSPCPAEAA